MLPRLRLTLSELPEEFEDLQSEILGLYSGLASSIQHLGRAPTSEKRELESRARTLCSQLEVILDLINDEIDQPEFSAYELEENCTELLEEARSLQSQLKRILERLQGHEH